MPSYWRLKKFLPERNGQPCEIVVRGLVGRRPGERKPMLGNIAVRFADGWTVSTSRWAVTERTPKRKKTQKAPELPW